jgi:hypothetical protein
LLWLLGLGAIYLALEWLLDPGEGVGGTLLLASGSAALAGGIGGATAMLRRLGQALSFDPDFARQSLLGYLIQPLTGLIVGLLLFYLITIPGSLAVNAVVNPDVYFGDIFASSTFLALQVLLSWLGGFYQRWGLGQLTSKLGRFLKKVDQPAEETALAQIEPTMAVPPYRPWLLEARLLSWSYSWGLALFVYALLWLSGLVVGLLWLVGLLWTTLDPSGQATLIRLMWAAWPVALAGGLGGVVGLLYDLYRHVSFQQDFDRQHLMYYLVQPVVGLVFGGIIYFFVASGYLGLQALVGEAPPVVDSWTIIMGQLALGVAVGFRQELIARLVDDVIAKIVTLFKLIGSLLNPFNLFKKERRTEILAQIGQQTGLFRPHSQRRQSDTGFPGGWWLPD